VEGAQRFSHIREQEAPFFNRFFIEAVEQFTQNALLLFLRDVRMINTGFPLCSTLYARSWRAQVRARSISTSAPLPIHVTTRSSPATGSSSAYSA
jgi:hypothetical protein